MPLTSRQLALRELSRLRKNGDEAFASCLRAIQSEQGTDPREKALAERIFTGTYQNRSYLEVVVSQFCRGKFSSLHPLMKDILCLSAYQIIYLDRIPPRAAVNEGVQLVRKKLNPGAAGMANAVLRKIADCGVSLPIPAGKGTPGYISTLYSHPQWLAEKLIERVGYDKAADFFRLDNQPADITIQINTLRISAREIFDRLQASDIEYTVPKGVEGCFIVSGLTDDVHSLLSQGLCFVQDLSARMCVEAAAPKAGDTVLDVCAAPGGKSFSSALAMGGEGRVISSDISPQRLAKLEEGARRLGLDGIVSCRCADASHGSAFEDVSADVVIVDAPCSGFGTIRKKPDIRAKAWEDTLHLHQTQFDILSNCAGYVRPGGTLIYSTCTVFKEENEDIVNRFLSSDSDFYLEDFALPDAFGRSETGMLTIWPWMANSDGFFIAKMRRKNESAD